MEQVFCLINLGALVCCLVGDPLQSISVLQRPAFEISWCHRHPTGYNPLCKSYRYVPPQRVWYLRLILHGLKMGIHFAHAFWLRIGYGFWGNYGSVWTYLSFHFQMCKKEGEICEKEIFFVGVESKKWWDNFLEARSENGCEKWNFLVWNTVTIWRTVQHTPTKNF